jgi:hypothetical protein
MAAIGREGMGGIARRDKAAGGRPETEVRRARGRAGCSARGTREDWRRVACCDGDPVPCHWRAGRGCTWRRQTSRELGSGGLASAPATATF